MSLEEIYKQISPEQRTSVAQHLMQAMGMPVGQAPANPSPAQVAELHTQAQQQHPGILESLRSHPALAGIVGGIATYELDKHFGAHK